MNLNLYLSQKMEWKQLQNYKPSLHLAMMEYRDF